MNLLNIFSDSLKITIEDILFIVGPNISHISKESVNILKISIGINFKSILIRNMMRTLTFNMMSIIRSIILSECIKKLSSKESKSKKKIRKQN
jgi:hypothetical protein